MFKDSDKYSVLMLLWLIAANTVGTGGWFPVAATVISVVYAGMAIYNTFKDN